LFSTLPQLEPTGDLLVQMDSLLGATVGNIAPGSMAHPKCGASAELLAAMLGSSKKDGLLAVRKSILETAAEAGIKLKQKAQRGRITHTQLEEYLAPFKSHPAAIRAFLPILQTISGGVAAIRKPDVAVWERWVATEKALLLGAMAPQTAEANVFGELSHLIPVPRLDGVRRAEVVEPTASDVPTRSSVKDVLAFILVCYLLELSTEETAPDEAQLQRALVHLLATEVPNTKRTELEQEIGELFTEFKRLAAIRTTQEYSTRLRGSSTDPDSVYAGLLKHVADKVFDPARPELSDLHHHSPSPSQKGLIHSGFGLIGGMIGGRKTRPSDFLKVVFVVLGGATGTEIKEVKDAVERHKTGVEVVVAGTNPIVTGHHVHAALNLGRFE
jgi:hypothetical protein